MRVTVMSAMSVMCVMAIVLVVITVLVMIIVCIHTALFVMIVMSMAAVLPGFLWMGVLTGKLCRARVACCPVVLAGLIDGPAVKRTQACAV